jgi:hypothetical protein
MILLISVTLVAGITGEYHHTQLSLFYCFHCRGLYSLVKFIPIVLVFVFFLFLMLFLMGMCFPDFFLSMFGIGAYKSY